MNTTVLSWALLACNLCCLSAAWAASPVEAFRRGDEVIVQFSSLDVLRQRHSRLSAVITLMAAQGSKSLTIDITREPATAIVINCAGFGVSSAQVDVKNGPGEAVLSERVALVPMVTTRAGIPLQKGVFAAIEPGSQMQSAPQIPLPDVRQLKRQTLELPTRNVKSSEITYPVIADGDLPGSGSTNAVIVSRQSFAPGDASRCSLYFSYRQPLFDNQTAQLREWRKMLVEVPLDRDWLSGHGDDIVTLPLGRFAIHTTEERELDGQRWNSTSGYNMLGGSSTGLFQGGQTVDVDDEGRIYITNVADGAGVIRFNPHTGKFEQPPINLFVALRKFIPDLEGWRRSWDADLAQAVLTRGRLYLVFDRNYRVSTPNGKAETCSGVVSLPLDHWNNAEAFRRDLRLHAACWPTAPVPLYAEELPIGGSRRLGAPQATTRGIAFGTFRLDLDQQGNVERLAAIKDLRDTADAAGRPLPPATWETTRGLRKQRLINVGAAGRAFVQQAYGEFTISRAALALTFPDAPAELLADRDGRHQSTFPGSPAGHLTVRFDLAAKLQSDPARYGPLAVSSAGISQGPSYAVIPIPGEPDQAIGVCEYSYFYSRLDFSKRVSERKVHKSYLTAPRDSRVPLVVGLGPYNSIWIDHGGERWLYMPGYTGIARLKYAAATSLQPLTTELIHPRLQPVPLDGVRRDSVKDYLHIVPALDGRLIDIGRGRVGRGGGARSAALELFDPEQLGASQTLCQMNRCFGLFTPVGRVVHSAAGQPPRQEIYVASGQIRPEYVEDLAAAERPRNLDPKVFAYEYTTAGGLRDMHGWALPLLPDQLDSSCNLALSACGQYLVLLQAGGAVCTYSLANQQFVAGLQLRGPGDQPVQPLEFSRPSATIWSAPNGQIFFFTALAGDKAKSVQYYEVRVARDGSLSIAPHLNITWESDARLRDFTGVVRCFLPDLKNNDGSYDLVLGSEMENGGQANVRVIEDFISPRR